MRRLVIALLVLTISTSASVLAQESDGPTCSGLPPTIFGTADNDRIHGTPGPDVISGGWGHDVIWGLGGDDVICGGVLDDHLNGGDGNDRVLGYKGEDTLVGGPGNDLLHDVDSARVYGNDGNDLITAKYWTTATPGAGDDVVRNLRLGTLLFSYASTGVTVDMNAGTATGEGNDTFEGVTWVFGSPSTTPSWVPRRSTICTDAAGDDVIFGGAQGDWVDGGLGDDRLDGGSEGGLGDNDLLSVAETSVGADVSLTRGTSTGPGNDTFVEFEHVWGSTFDDLIEGDDQNNILLGWDGNDRVSGLAGDDRIHSFEVGDAGLGSDVCLLSRPVESCERHEAQSRSRVAVEVVSPRPHETIPADSFSGVEAKVVEGEGPAVRRRHVALSLVSDQGCQWWSERADRFVWRACARPQWNAVVEPAAPLPPGDYRAYARAVLVDGTRTGWDSVGFTVQ